MAVFNFCVKIVYVWAFVMCFVNFIMQWGDNGFLAASTLGWFNASLAWLKISIDFIHTPTGERI
jgi:hypothetical protein